MGTDIVIMRMLNGRRPRRPDDNFYRESRRSAIARRSQRPLGLATVIVVVAVVTVIVAWWLFRGTP